KYISTVQCVRYRSHSAAQIPARQPSEAVAHFDYPTSMTVPNPGDLSQRCLWGGAATCVVPTRMVDVSDIRQVPDNQEVFMDTEANQTFIFEIVVRNYAVHLMSMGVPILILFVILILAWQDVWHEISCNVSCWNLYKHMRYSESRRNEKLDEDDMFQFNGHKENLTHVKMPY
ncbi:hypothetical protein Vretimale_17817, partial [Volvox reticuliferus]